jgi:hypothetical protein
MRLVADFLRVSRRSRLPAMLVVHHLLGLRRQIVLVKRVLCRVVVHERDDVGEFLAGEVDLLAQRFLLRGNHRWRVVPHHGGEVEWIDEPHVPVRIHWWCVMSADAIDRMTCDTPLVYEDLLASVGVHQRNNETCTVHRPYRFAGSHVVPHCVGPKPQSQEKGDCKAGGPDAETPSRVTCHFTTSAVVAGTTPLASSRGSGTMLPFPST